MLWVAVNQCCSGRRKSPGCQVAVDRDQGRSGHGRTIASQNFTSIQRIFISINVSTGKEIIRAAGHSAQGKVHAAVAEGAKGFSDFVLGLRIVQGDMKQPAANGGCICQYGHADRDFKGDNILIAGAEGQGGCVVTRREIPAVGSQRIDSGPRLLTSLALILSQEASTVALMVPLAALLLR